MSRTNRRIHAPSHSRPFSMVYWRCLVSLDHTVPHFQVKIEEKGKSQWSRGAFAKGQTRAYYHRSRNKPCSLWVCMGSDFHSAIALSNLDPVSISWPHRMLRCALHRRQWTRPPHLCNRRVSYFRSVLDLKNDKIHTHTHTHNGHQTLLLCTAIVSSEWCKRLELQPCPCELAQITCVRENNGNI